MNEDKIIKLFHTFIDKTEKLVDKYSVHIPLFGDVAAFLVNTLLKSSASVVDKRVDDILNNAIKLQYTPIVGATKIRVVKFFSSFPELKDFYDENKDVNFKDLKVAYTPLYKIKVLEDPILTFFYEDELKNEDYAFIVRDYWDADGELAKFISTLDGMVREGKLEGLVTAKDYFKEFLSNISEPLGKSLQTKLLNIFSSYFGGKKK